MDGVINPDEISRRQQLEAELASVKELNAKLLAEQEALVSKLQAAEAKCKRQKKVSDELKALSRKYKALAGSRLGSLTLHWWRIKGGLKKRYANVMEKKKKRIALAATKVLAPTNFNPATCSLAKRLKTVMSGKIEYKALGEFLKTVKVACIMDEFTWKSYSPEANMIQLVPEDYGNQLKSFKPELIFIESAWRGIDNKWTNSVSKMPDELKGILKWARKNGVPTIFWNKEDPIHFDTFKDVAMLFDFIFTYDFDCVQKYKQLTGKNNAFYLPMAVQPGMFNPIEKYERKDAFCFAGSYYKRYVERSRDFDGYIKVFPTYKGVEIYDRQFGLDNPNYMMPPEYAPYIKGHLPYDEIDKSYKGYTVSINLNSIKQANSIARRVFELLACNTVTVSNFSQGVVTGFGDLVVTSDSADVIIGKLKQYEANPLNVERFKLLGLRKVFSESTYRDRFAYICSKVLGVDLTSCTPSVAIVAKVQDEDEYRRVEASFARQAYVNKKLLVVGKEGSTFAPDAIQDWGELKNRLAGFDYVGVMSPEDYYAEHYLDDLVFAFKYAPADAVCKGTYFAASGDSLTLKKEAKPYAVTEKVSLCRGLMKTDVFVAKASADAEALCGGGAQIEMDALSIDMFNYCENGARLPETQIEGISDLAGIDSGFSFSEMQAMAEKLEPVWQGDEEGKSISAAKLFNATAAAKAENITASLMDSELIVNSSLGKGEKGYFTIWKKRPIEKMPIKNGKLNFNLEAEYSAAGLLRLAYFFFDENNKKLSSAIGAPNANLTADVPEGAKKVMFQLRLFGGGTVGISALNLFHKPTPLPYYLDKNEVLCFVKSYPAYDNLYKNGFVHTRVRLYARNGVKVTVFKLTDSIVPVFSEFEGIRIISGNESYFRFIMSRNKYNTVLVHFLDADLWNPLKDLPKDVRIIAWSHGSDVVLYHRRMFNFTTEAQLERAKIQSEKTGAFWRNLLPNIPSNLHFVFVSNWIRNVAENDYDVLLPVDKYSIINNPIDTDLFRYEDKSPELRYKILSIRPFASRTYANDLSVKCIEELSKRADFDKFEITIIGDGPLFDEVTKPLRKFTNVHINRKFIRQSEIYEYHKKNGIFLVPSRADTQGVSRDEAMSSGLVPVTNGVTAIPEFVDDSCSILAPGEDYKCMAQGIGRLVDNPGLFAKMSRAAAERVRRQTASNVIVNRELALIKGISLA